MKYVIVLLYLAVKLTCVENLVSVNYETIPMYPENIQPHESENSANLKVVAIQDFEDKDEDEVVTLKQHTKETTTKKPCLVMVLSNTLNPSMQSLLRKYRYDANGVLIPSSVKYYIKLPQGRGLSPLLVPINDKAFSPRGGFVRYYKEVPPIPHVW